ncbi:hypothetical protein F4780DRAFT_796146 [Xylariomycetidae sp. FL0641]|nr:hypothetical protein F4780DRAFT_796146 [Xylariomycetidae sp. FL0641]
MADRDESDPSHPRKRIAVAVSSTETHLRNEGNDYAYNLDAARSYTNQSRGAISPLNPLPQYAGDVPPADMMASYRGTPYQYGSKNYYNMSGWTGTYPEDVDYGLNYSSYPIMNQESAHMVQGYGRYGSSKSVYVEPEQSSYPYGSLVHRPAASSDSQGFSLSSMAASLPNPDRLHSQVNRTLTGSSSYRDGSGVPSQYTTAATTSAKGASSSTIPEVAGYTTPFDSYSTTSAARAGHHADTAAAAAAAYTSSSAAAEAAMYNPSGEHAAAAADPTAAGTAGLSYIYSSSSSDKVDGSSSSRRGSSPSHASSSATTTTTAAPAVLANGHVYVPEPHHASSSSSYAVASRAAAAAATGDGGSSSSTSASERHGHGHGHSSGRHHHHHHHHHQHGRSSGAGGGSSQSDGGHRRSAGSLRGGG